VIRKPVQGHRQQYCEFATSLTDSHNVSYWDVMGRPPLNDKPMTSTERTRRSRQRAEGVEVRASRIRRAFEAAGEDAQALFIKWLQKISLID
jgi:hypothetical protein